MIALLHLEDRIFSEERVRLFGWALLAVEIVVFASAIAAGRSIITSAGTPRDFDFGCFWVGGSFAGSAHPASVYDPAALLAAHRKLYAAPADFPNFLYPPTFLLFAWVLWLMPYVAAFAAWLVGTFLIYQAAARAILPRAGILLMAAAPLPVIINAQLGQNGFLSAGLIGLSLALVERRPVLAGILLGLLTYKPQFGVLFPLALIAGAHWRVIASATVTALTLAFGATVMFGRDIWPAYVESFRGFDVHLSPDPRIVIPFQSVFGWAQWAGADPAFAGSAHAIEAAVAAAVVCAIWFRPAPYPLKAAALCVGAVAITPFVLTYDLCILTIALAFLLRDGLLRGFLPGERIILLSCFFLSLLLLKPIGPVLYALLLGVVVWRLLALRGAAAEVAAASAGAPV